MTSKHWVSTIVFLSMALGACGAKDSYKAARATLNQSATPAGHEVAEPTVEEKALALLQNDARYSEIRSTLLSERLQTEYAGLSLQQTSGTQQAASQTFQIALLKTEQQDCNAQERTLVLSQSPLSLTAFPSVGRFQCLEEGCEHILLLIEARRHVRAEATERGSIQSGVAAVLLKRDEAGMHKPLRTESGAFLNLNDVSTAIQVCEQVQRSAVEEADPTREQLIARLRVVLQRMREINTELNALMSTPHMDAQQEALTQELMNLEDQQKVIQQQLQRQAAARRADAAQVEEDARQQRVVDAYKEYYRSRIEGAQLSAEEAASVAPAVADEAVPVAP